MKNQIKWIVFMVVLLMLLSIFIGCGKTRPSEPAGNNTNANANTNTNTNTNANTNTNTNINNNNGVPPIYPYQITGTIQQGSSTSGNCFVALLNTTTGPVSVDAGPINNSYNFLVGTTEPGTFVVAWFDDNDPSNANYGGGHGITQGYSLDDMINHLTLITMSAASNINLGQVAWYELPLTPDLFINFEGNVDDESSNDYDTVNHNVAFSSGRIGQAGSFNGTNSSVEVDDLDFEVDFATVCMWVKPTTKNVILLDNFGVHTPFRIGINQDRKFYFDLLDIPDPDPSVRRTAFSTTDIQNDTWYYLSAVLYDERTMAVFVNGVLEGTAYVVNRCQGADGDFKVGYTDTTANPPDVGTIGNCYPFSGLIDELRVFEDRALTTAEIVSLMNLTN